MENIKCPKCGNEKIWKSGKNKGKQQYKCKECGRKFITDYLYDKNFKIKSMQIFYEGNSGRAVGRIMGISRATVYNWIKKADTKLSMNIEEKSDKITKEIIEMDELYCYIENKKKEHI